MKDLLYWGPALTNTEELSAFCAFNLAPESNNKPPSSHEVVCMTFVFIPNALCINVKGGTACINMMQFYSQQLYYADQLLLSSYTVT